jgi:hypothetical protein
MRATAQPEVTCVCADVLHGWCARLHPTGLPVLELVEDDEDENIDGCVQAAVAAWGERKLGALEAEDRLSVACEKGETSDEVMLQLRAAFQVRPTPSGVLLAPFVCVCVCVCSISLGLQHRMAHRFMDGWMDGWMDVTRVQ